MVAVSVVIPVYRSQESVGQVVETLAHALPQWVEAFEVILVEDGSPDDTWQAVEQLAQHYHFVRGVRLIRNFGQHNALLCGIRLAQYEVVITMDDDLQHPVDAIPSLLDALKTHDVVYASPMAEQYGSVLRSLATYMTKWVLGSAMGSENAQHISAYRAFKTPLREAFAQFHGPYVNLDVLLTWGTTRFTRLPVIFAKRTVGQSNYTLSKLITHTFNLLTGFSTLPLQLASMLGFVMTAFGMILLVYIIVIRILIFGYDVPGFTFLASVIAIFSGAQLFTLGVMGEYLSRMHFRMMDKPTFVVAQDIHQTGAVE